MRMKTGCIHTGSSASWSAADLQGLSFIAKLVIIIITGSYDLQRPCQNIYYGLASVIPELTCISV